MNNLQSSRDFNEVNFIDTDQNGNIYILARIGGAGVKVGNQDLIAYSEIGIASTIDMVLCSYTSNGNYRWSKVIGGFNNDYGYGLKVDESGHVYVQGLIQNSKTAAVGVQPSQVHFDTDTILPRVPLGVGHLGYKDTLSKSLFLVQYDTAGVFQWLSMPEPDTTSYYRGNFSFRMDLDSAGNVYWWCYLQPGEYEWLGNNIITTEGMYILKYSPQGHVTEVIPIDIQTSSLRFWAFEGSAYFERHPSSGNFYIAGFNNLYSDIIIAGDTIASRMYLACFSPQGQFLWKRLSSGANLGSVQDFKMDHSGQLYLTGEMVSGTTFGGYTYLSPNQSSSPYVACLDENGNQLWSRMSVAGAASGGYGVAVGDSEVAITGDVFRLYWPGETDTIFTEYNAGYDAYIARFNKRDGTLIAMDRTHTSHGAGSYGNAIAAGSQNTYYMGGNFDAAMYLGQDTLYKVGSQRSFFLTKYTCDVPESNYSYTGVNDTNLVTFTYTGAAADSVKWYLGDGTQVWGDTITHYYQTAGMYHVCAEAFFECTEATYCDTIYAGSIGVQEEERLGMVFYPNPTNGILHVENLEEGATLYIYNLNGQALFETHAEGRNAELDIANFPQGVYLLVVETGGDWYYENVVKE